MRLSTDSSDPGYDRWAVANVAHILLDGEKIDYCVTADEEEGYVLAILQDALGQMLYDVDSGEPMTQELYGDVRILLAGD